MLLSLPELVTKYNMKVRGVLHCGAHLAEEAVQYDLLHMHDVWWVEGNPAVIDVIESNLYSFPAQQLIHALIYSEEGVELDFNITNYQGMSSSILEFGTHPTFSPDTVFVNRIKMVATTIDTLAKEYDVVANLLNMDLQGAELHALKGATKFLKGTDYIFTEVNNDEVYVDCARVEQLDEFLADDFDRVETYWVPGQGWGDALYVRRSLL